MGNRPKGVSVDCSDCNEETIAIIPQNGSVVEDDANSDGKVWASCTECGERFLVYYQLES